MAAEVHAAAPGIKELYVTINLLVVIAIVVWAGRKSIPEALKARTERFRKRLVESRLELERYRAEIEKARSELGSLESTKSKILAETEEEGRKVSERLVADAHNTATRILADAKAAADDELRTAMDQLKSQLVREAVEQARNILQSPECGETLRKKAHENLVSQFLKDTSVAKKKLAETAERITNGK